MSNFSNLIVFAACFGAGFFIEPKIFRNGDSESQSDTEPRVEVSQNEPATSSDAPELNINMDLSKVLPEDFPEKVTLLKPINFSDEVSGVSMDIAQGAFVKPIRLNGDNLVIQPIGIPIENEIPVDDTNFKQLVVPIMLARLQNAKGNTEPSEAPPAPEVKVKEDSTPEIKEEPTPSVSETPSPSPENQLPAATTAKATGLTEEEIIAKMKESILAGMVKEFVPEQISEMKTGTPAEVDGIVYEETGHIIFIAQTILGEQKNGAIALFRDGSVEKWVWAKNMLEMR